MLGPSCWLSFEEGHPGSAPVLNFSSPFELLWIGGARGMVTQVSTFRQLILLLHPGDVDHAMCSWVLVVVERVGRP